MLTFLIVFALNWPSHIVDLNRHVASSSQIQRFEEPFSLSNTPQEFLPGWTGNDVRSTSSRIFQSLMGRNGSKALAVQPISSFNGLVTVRLQNEEFADPIVQFWARSIQNGTGTRAAEVYYSWKSINEPEFGVATILGDLKEFANENQEFRKFQIAVPEELKTEAELMLRFEIRYGAGTGNAARWILDDFEFGELIPDASPPQLVTVRGYDSTSIELTFNEALDPVFSIFSLNYEIEGVQFANAELRSDSLVYLFSVEKFEPKKIYSLGIRQIPDLEGNFIKDTLVSFTFFDPTEIPFKGLVINEIMPAPKADLDLPNVEYVEIFNAGEQDFRLDELTWTNSRSSTSLPVAWIAPGDYLILVSENQASALEDYGNTLPIRNWPSLLNAGDQLRILDSKGSTIDQLSYSTASWQGAEFAAGGYSLEVANPFYTCDQSDLVRVSVDPLRGTPGRVNSVFGEETNADSPELTSAYFQNETTIVLDFSIPIFSNFNVTNFEINPTLKIKEVSLETANRILIRLETSAVANTPYSLRANGISGCNGVEFPSEKLTQLILAIPAVIGDLVINEVLFNPKTGFPKFVELHNTTDSYLSFGSWQLANLDDLGKPAQLRKLGSENLIIPPNGFLAFTTDISQLLFGYSNSDVATFIALSSLPSYPIAGGNVVLLDGSGQVAEIFSYSEDLHHPLLRDPKGVSLERISSSISVSVTSNWHSAAETAGFASPGKKNSQFISEEFDGSIIQIEPEVFDPEGSNGNTFTSIKYELDQAGWVGNLRIYSISGQLIQSLAQNELLGSQGLFTWTGTDTSGKIVRPGYYILLVELFDLSGNLKSIKKTIVVATRF